VEILFEFSFLYPDAIDETERTMKFHGLMLVRDEADILPETMAHLLEWIDALYILDLGSTDSTWQILRELAAKDSRIVLHESKPIVYQDGLRCILFDAYRDRFKNGDWILKIDADEIYHITPPEFVRHHLRPGETSVNLMWYFFRLTSPEVDAYATGQTDIEQDRLKSIMDRRRFYKIADYSEPRMFKYRATMQWQERSSFPFNAGYLARNRIPIQHYPHRDPWQMAKRYQLRSAMDELKTENGPPHWALQDWRQDIIRVDASGKATEQNQSGVGLAASSGHTAGELLYLSPGEILPEVHSTAHLASLPKRLLQRLVHPLCLPILDRLRPGFSKNYQPDLIPDQVTLRLAKSIPAPF
jgi:hypothetical protein